MSVTTKQTLQGSLSSKQSITGKVLTGRSGGTNFITDNHTLKIGDDGVLRVNTADAVEQDNTLPVTSAAVHTQIGNIETLLQTI